MRSKIFPLSTLCFVLSGFGLLACSDTNVSTEVAMTAAPCTAQDDVSASCILDLAHATLATINPGYDWVSSAGELALAMDSGGDAIGAWALMGDAVERASEIEDMKKRGTALADLALGLKFFKKNTAALPIINAVQFQMNRLESGSAKTDIMCKLVTAMAVHNDPIKARQSALTLSDEGDTANAFRGRTQREIAAILAKEGDFEMAISMLNEITADFDYYKAIAHTDIMSIAARAGRHDIVYELKDGAEAIANSQKNPYYTAAILRDIAHSLIILGDNKMGMGYFDEALEAAGKAPKFQEKARSTSRIVTRLADVGKTGKTFDILQGALTLAKQEESTFMQNFSIYEIAGSAAFSGHTDMSKTLIEEMPDTPFGSARSLKAAGQRDLAWGLVRMGNMKGGMEVAKSIIASREKVQTFSRIIRLLNNPKMSPVPRYL